MKLSYKNILPEYPSLRHLPWKPNNKSDKIATEAEASVIFEKNVSVQEKLDAANCGMVFFEGYPVVRSRSKILRKGQHLKNPSQTQFASAWNWMHENKGKFELLEERGSFTVYGEWMIQQHGMVYDKLPDWFIAYDIFDYEKGHFLMPDESLALLSYCGFCITNQLFYGKLDSYEQLESMANGESTFASAKREGVVVKVTDGNQRIYFKMVRQGFDQGSLLSDELKRNKLGR